MASPLGYVYSRADALKRQLYDMITNPRDYASMLGGRIVEGGQEREALMNQAFADPTNPLKITNEKALAALTDKIMQGEMGITPLGITAYHGSPYLFKQFDPMKVGTGEGAQAYGVGAGYTSEARQIAEKFARNIPKNSDAYGAENVANRLYKGGFDDEYIKNRLKTVFSGLEDEQISNAIKVAKSPSSAGYLYKGDIPDEIIPKFLDFDRPISSQSQEIQNLAKKYKIDPDDLGGDLVSAVGKGAEGSSIMEKAGIVGIKYTDITGSNLVSNFIPFNPQDFKIQEINDMPISDWISRGLLAP